MMNVIIFSEIVTKDKIMPIKDKKKTPKVPIYGCNKSLIRFPSVPELKIIDCSTNNDTKKQKIRKCEFDFAKRIAHIVMESIYWNQ